MASDLLDIQEIIQKGFKLALSLLQKCCRGVSESLFRGKDWHLDVGTNGLLNCARPGEQATVPVSDVDGCLVGAKNLDLIGGIVTGNRVVNYIDSKTNL
jgi:hypothetical protein